MKLIKILSLTLSIILFIFTVSCDIPDIFEIETSPDFNESESSSVDLGNENSNVPTDSDLPQKQNIRFDIGRIDVVSYTEDETYGRVITLTDDEAEKIVAILNNSVWDIAISKEIYDYTFEVSDTTIRYVAKRGLFNDPVNDRHAFVSEEERIYINSLIVSLMASE